jgi:hypothetical protein
MSPEIISAIAWPASVFLIIVALGIAFLATQRKAIGGLLGRATKVSAGPTGAVIEAAARAEQQQVEASKPAQAPALPAPPAPSTGALRSPLPDAHPLYDPFDAYLRAQLDQTFGEDNVEAKLAWAIRLRSQVLVERSHETNYRVIFTSQIWALKQLNLVGETSLSQARKVYDEAAKQNPEFYRRVTWESWSRFLQNTGYVQVGAGDDPTVTLTPLGNDFMVWMAARRVLEVKPY